MGWLDDADIVDITKDGEYEIASLSTGVGRRAARISVPGKGILYLEWRLGVGMDLDLGAAQMFVDRTGKVFKSLLVTTLRDPKADLVETVLVKLIDQGKTFVLEQYGLTFSVHAAVPGKFTVKGVVAPEPVVPRITSSNLAVEEGVTLCPKADATRLFQTREKNSFAGMARATDTFKLAKFREAAFAEQGVYLVKRCSGGLFIYVAAEDVFVCDKPCDVGM